ncbi:ankyrin repeat domain-containing protein [Flavobacterium sp.]|uniref:ankyrin repeat domain-containing protein n=1 Tax=Flavobacterium sp. TaxID=239 RepID=UPI002FDA2F9A
MTKIIQILICIAGFNFHLLAQTDLIQMVRVNDYEGVQKAVKLNPDLVNQKSNEGFTPLILASYRGNLDMVKFLLDSGAQVNVGTSMGSALMAATVKGHYEVVALLLEREANPDLTDSEGTTALMYAVQFRNVALTKLLLLNKASKTLLDSKGKSAFEYAVFTGNEEIINLLK